MTICRATPHLTPDARFVRPTPIIEPAITWVVLTGMPKWAVPRRVMAPLLSAQKPSTGLSFVSLVPDCVKAQENEVLMIENRGITARKVCDDVAWFEFRELCDGPRSQNDYI